jgi:hypothetical protein
LGPTGEAAMMGRVTLREVRDALAAAKVTGAKAPATSPTLEELESLARVLERQVVAAPNASPGPAAPADESRLKAAAEQGAAADDGGQRGIRRSSRPRGSRRR